MIIESMTDGWECSVVIELQRMFFAQDIKSSNSGEAADCACENKIIIFNIAAWLHETSAAKESESFAVLCFTAEWTARGSTSSTATILQITSTCKAAKYQIVMISIRWKTHLWLHNSDSNGLVLRVVLFKLGRKEGRKEGGRRNTFL